MNRKAAKATKPKKKTPVQKHLPDDLKQLAERITALRIKNGYKSYEEFAYEKKFNRSQYGRYERGEDLRYTSLLRVIRAFNLTPEQFFSEGFD